LANYLAAAGVDRDDCVGVNTPQRPAPVISHLAIWKLGGVTVPLSNLFGEDAVSYRLQDCEATACIVDASNVDALHAVTEDILSLETVLTVGTDSLRDDETDFWTAITSSSREFENAPTGPESDTIIAYTSGTTGQPKGVQHGHRVLLAHLSLLQHVHEP